MTVNDEKREVAFVRKLVDLWEDRGAMANLRRGLRVENPKADARMVSTIAPMLYGVSASDEDRFYWIASLFATVHTGSNKPVWMKMHLDEPAEIWKRHTIGEAFHKMSAAERRERNLKPDKKTSTDSRFEKLMNSNWEDLPNRLRHAVRQLASRHGSDRERVDIDWVRLLHDIAPRRFNSPERYIQQAWANSYWRTTTKKEEENKTTEKTENA